LDLLTAYAQHSELHVIIALPLISEIYSLVLQTLVSSVITASTILFLATDFNTGAITVSVNYILQISLYYSTCKVFSSLPDFQPNSLNSSIICQLPTPELSIQFSPATSNSGTLNPVLCCNFQLRISQSNSLLQIPTPDSQYNSLL
jgi:hypothetical protein